MSRINWLSFEELANLEKQMDLVKAEFLKVGNAIEGWVPARIIDKWLDLDRKLHILRNLTLDVSYGEASRRSAREI